MRTALLQSHRQQQLQIKANIKSGNFPRHRLKVTQQYQRWYRAATCSNQANRRIGEQADLPPPTTHPPPQPTLNLTEPNSNPTLALLIACHMRVRKDFRFTLLLANSSSPPRSPLHQRLRITAPPPHTLCNCFVRQMQGSWRMPRLLPS